MSVTTDFPGRLGNCFYNICNVIAHCKKYNLDYAFPTGAWACTNGKPTIIVPDTGVIPSQPQIYNESVDTEGHPYYHEIPVRDNVIFRGYYQSFLYFEWCREDILRVFNLPHSPESITAIHIRRGDNTQADHFIIENGVTVELFPIAPRAYYQAAVQYIQKRGFNNFRIYTEPYPGDENWCVQEFTQENYPDAIFEFRKPSSEIEDYISLSNCQNLICARSTYSLTAGWMNQNPDKIVICPTGDIQWWKGMNRNLLTGTEHWLTQLSW